MAHFSSLAVSKQTQHDFVDVSMALRAYAELIATGGSPLTKEAKLICIR
jgi:hypothetical protein